MKQQHVQDVSGKTLFSCSSKSIAELDRSGGGTRRYSIQHPDTLAFLPPQAENLARMTQFEALVTTVAVELVVALAVLRAFAWYPASWRRAIAVVCAASLLSHPFAWDVNTVWLRAWPFDVRAAAIEVAVVAFESCVLAWGLPIAARRAVLVATLANLGSFALGLLIA